MRHGSAQKPVLALRELVQQRQPSWHLIIANAGWAMNPPRQNFRLTPLQKEYLLKKIEERLKTVNSA